MVTGEHVNCEHDPEGADGNPFAAMVCSPMGPTRHTFSVDNVSAADRMSTSAALQQAQAALINSQADLTAMQRQRDEAEAELTNARATIVDLLYTLDAFQIESGADRNASHQTGIEAVRKLRDERDEQLDESQAKRGQLFAENQTLKAHLETLRAQLARHTQGTDNV